MGRVVVVGGLGLLFEREEREGDCCCVVFVLVLVLARLICRSFSLSIYEVRA